ncbi:MAG: T9SS type A sorting domain-containing protein, partial [Bacteroidetes bacterium]
HHNPTYPSNISLPGNNNFLGSKELTSAIQIFPNPAKDWVMINNDLPITFVRITDISGKVMLELEDDNIKKINLNVLSSGTYLLECISENEKYRSTIIKQ